WENSESRKHERTKPRKNLGQQTSLGTDRGAYNGGRNIPEEDCSAYSTPSARRRLSRILGAMRQAAAQTPEPEPRAQSQHFVKVTKSYWPGLFPCDASPETLRTHNDLEHLFGSHR